jgi:propionyl-CoA synthetase
VVGVADEIKGEIPVAFVTIKVDHEKTHRQHTVARESVALVRDQIGAVASFKHCHIVPRLPKTRSGKYLRHIVRKMYNKENYDVPSTIEDMDVIHELHRLITDIHAGNEKK